MIRAVLDDAEDRQTREESVKMWLDDLQNLAYDLEGILDEFQTESSRRLLPQEPAAVDQSSASTSTCRKFTDSLKRKVTDAVTLRKIPKLSASDSPRSSFNFESEMVSKVEDITARLQDIERRKDLLNLKNVISDGESRNVTQRSPSTSSVNEAEVYDMETEKEEIVELLLGDELRADDGFFVISINGMGGVGKTTLAQLVFNDDRVQRHFQIRAWTCVSEDFDVFRISKSILNAVASDRCMDIYDLNLLQKQLKKQLSGKKSLLVLDDVWNEKYENWSILDQEYNGRKMEDLGREFVGELHSRSLFVMRDLINDLARWAAGEMCFRMDDTFEGRLSLESVCSN